MSTPLSTYVIASAVDPGRSRQNNEDSVIVDEAAGVAVLADGMGGYNAGEVASGMATHLVHQELVRWLGEEGRGAGHQEVRRAMERAADAANRTIFNSASLNADYQGMGTTLVSVVLRESVVVIGHIGDSRAYRLRAGRLARLTRDHSLLQEQIDAGLITPEEAAFSNIKNLVTRAMGVEDTVKLETHVHDTREGDELLICSDGLSDMLPDATIEEMLRAGGAVEQVCRQLVDAANEAGGRDNISVVLARAVSRRAAGPRAWWRFGRTE